MPETSKYSWTVQKNFNKLNKTFNISVTKFMNTWNKLTKKQHAYPYKEVKALFELHLGKSRNLRTRSRSHKSRTRSRSRKSSHKSRTRSRSRKSSRSRVARKSRTRSRSHKRSRSRVARKSKIRSRSRSSSRGGCSRETQSKYLRRGSPPYSANKCKGRVMEGNDGKWYKSKNDKNGVYHWKLAH